MVPLQLGQRHLSLQAGTNVTCKVRFLSEVPREEGHRAKFHFLNNSLLAIVKKHKVGEKGGIFIPYVRSTFARQSKVQFCTLFSLYSAKLATANIHSLLNCTVATLCSTNSHGHTEDQGVHFRGGGQSKVCLRTGLQNTANGAARLPGLD